MFDILYLWGIQSSPVAGSGMIIRNFFKRNTDATDATDLHGFV